MKSRYPDGEKKVIIFDEQNDRNAPDLGLSLNNKREKRSTAFVAMIVYFIV